MLITIAQAGLGLLTLYFGGEWLVRGATALAMRLGVSPLAIGLTVVAFGTSLPELVVSIDASLSGASDISVGNVVGSNIANIALILGIATVLRPAVVEAKVVRFDAPLVVLVSCLLAAVLFNGVATPLEGGLMLLGLIVYTVFTFWEASRETETIRDEFASAAPEAHAGIAVSLGLVGVGLALLMGGGRLLVISAVDLATALGVSQAVIGLTIVAVGTSLPELVTSVVASLRGQGDIAIGNVVGSNLFNILGILGTTAIIAPLGRGNVGWSDVGAMCGLAALLAVLLFARRRLGRVEGALFLVCYVVYVATLVGA